MRISMPIDGPDIEIPAHPDGENWVHIMEHGGNDGDVIVYADTAAELLGALIDGYDNIPDDDIDDAEMARFEHAIVIASTLQAFLTASAIDRGEFVADDADDDTLTALMTEKSKPVTINGNWDCPVPLVLVDTCFAPFSDEPLPEGNVVILNTYDEVEYLSSLSAISMINYYVRATGVEEVDNDA